MAVTKQDVTKIARLARLAVTEPEKDHYAKEISGILNWVEQLSEVNTDNVLQLNSVSNQPLPWRKDVVNDGNQQELVVKNAVNEHGCFVVPKVIE